MALHLPKPGLGPVSWENMARGIEKVRERLYRATAALESARIPYAVIGGNAIAAWVSRVDESVVRNTQDVDLLLRRDDLAAAKVALEKAGFIHRAVSILGGKGRIEMFLDGPDAKARDAVRVIFAGERVSDDSLKPSPGIDEIDPGAAEGFRLLHLEALVRMKLTSFRRKDQVHLLDLMETGQLDASWLERLPEALRGRLQELLDNPEG